MTRFACHHASWAAFLFGAVVSGSTAPAAPPTNDPLFADQWYLQNTGQVVSGTAGTPGADITAPSAWVIHAGSSTVTVAIVGSGVNPHAEFAARLLAGRAFAGDPFDTSDGCGTGTHVAGLIGAQGDNGVGIAGLAGPVRLLPVRVESGCVGAEPNLARGLEWAVDAGAKVIVVTGLYYLGTPELAAAIAYAANHDVLVFAPLGAAGTATVAFPAGFEECVAVTATDQLDQRASLRRGATA